MGFFRSWYDVASESDFAETDRKVVVAGGEQILLVKVGDRIHAVSAICTHEYAPMAGGTVSGHEIECPLHGARFDLRSGTNLSPPATRPLEVYETRVENGRIWVRV
ncbi:MAG: non-heme iron oxygenase ferredoxin subunit [Kiritimatiellae bacterium]|nr:non-heme iron oxygenase ferredoxin subunit [Kiritimatiellia bacterium]